MLHRIHRFRFDIVNDRYENIYEKKKRVYEYLHFLFDFINEYVNERLIRIGFNLTKGVACIINSHQYRNLTTLYISVRKTASQLNCQKLSQGF